MMKPKQAERKQTLNNYKVLKMNNVIIEICIK